MTKREFFNYVIENVANEEVVAQAKHEIELLDRKNSSRGSKLNAKQVANEEIKANIVAMLTDAEPMTVGAIANAYNEKYGTDYSSNKVNALVTQLKNANLVVREVVKKVAYFRVA